jgi:hypothetical protein
LKAKTVTGDGRDHIELVPETIAEAAELVFIGRSTFMPAGSCELIVTLDLRPFLLLRIYAGAPAPAKPLDGATRDELDRTP